MKYFTVSEIDSAISPSISKEMPANNAACSEATWKPMRPQQTMNISVSPAGTNKHAQIETSY